MWSAVMVNSGGDSIGPETVTPAVISAYDDLYEGYNDFDPQILVYGDSNPSPQVAGERKLDHFPPSDHMAGHSQTSSMSENQGGKSDVFTVRTPTRQITSMWRPSTTGRTTRARSMISAPQTEVSRPMTAVRAAGYSSRGSRFDPLNQAARSSTSSQSTKEENNPEYQSRRMERLVNQLLEESAPAIDVQYPVRHVHFQKGLAESVIKRLQLIARPLLMHSQLPISA